MRTVPCLLAPVLAAALGAWPMPAPALAAEPAPPAANPRTVEKREVLVFRGPGDRAVEVVAAPAARGFLGVNLLDLTAELRRHFGVPEDRGVLVSRVLDESPAARAGLRPGDVVTAADGEALPSGLRLSLRIAAAGERRVVDLEYWRDGGKSSVRIPLDVRRRTQFDLAPLVRQRLEIERPQVILRRLGHETAGTEIEWVGDLAEQLDDGMSQTTFLQQLEAMRLERAALQRRIQGLEERLARLEAELEELDDD